MVRRSEGASALGWGSACVGLWVKVRCGGAGDGRVRHRGMERRWAGGRVVVSEGMQEMGRAVGCIVGEECGKLGNFGATLR